MVLFLMLLLLLSLLLLLLHIFGSMDREKSLFTSKDICLFLLRNKARVWGFVNSFMLFFEVNKHC